MTVTGTIWPVVSQTCVMPTLVPSRARMTGFCAALAPAVEVLVARIVSTASELDLDVDARREVEPHEAVHRLRGRVEDVDQPLVRTHLEVLARVLVLVRRTNDAVHVLLGGQRHRADHPGTRTRHRFDDLACRRVDRLMVIGLEPDADLL